MIIDPDPGVLQPCGWPGGAHPARVTLVSSKVKVMLSPAQAAKNSGVSRTTIMNAIKSGALTAIRTNSGWNIDPDDLAKWASPPDKTFMQSESQVVTELRLELAGLRGELKGKTELVDLLKSQLEQARLPFWRRWF